MAIAAAILQNGVLECQDGTLAVVKGRATYPVDENDWKYFNKNVPKELQNLREKGFKIVIFR